MMLRKTSVVLLTILVLFPYIPTLGSPSRTRFRTVVFYYGWLNTSNLISLRFDILVFAGTRNVMNNQYSVISKLRERGVEVYAYLHDGDRPIGMGTSFRRWVAQNRTGGLEERVDSWRRYVEGLIAGYRGKVDGIFLDECDPAYFGTTDPDDVLVREFSKALEDVTRFARSEGLKVFVNGVRAYASLGDYYLWEDFVSVYDSGYKLSFPEGGSINPYDWTNGLLKYEYLLKHGLLNRTIALSFADRSTIRNAELAYYMARVLGLAGWGFSDIDIYSEGGPVLKAPVFELGPPTGPLRIRNGIFERNFTSGRLVVNVDRWTFSSPVKAPLTVFDEFKAPRPPNGWKLEASMIDRRFNEDLLRNTSTRSSWVMFLGGPEVHESDPEVPGEGFWSSGGVRFLREGGFYRGLIVGSRTLISSYGNKDYCVIHLEMDGRLYIAGVTRYGTRAGLIWASNPDGWYYTTHLNLVVLEWVDKNGNGRVDLWEIHPVITG